MPAFPSMPAPRVIKLLVISDIVCIHLSSRLRPPLTQAPLLYQICPWCYIGQREMERAIEMCKDLPVTVEIEYRRYRIYPSLKDGQFLDKREWYETRFGKEKVETMEKMATQRAEQLGIQM